MRKRFSFILAAAFLLAGIRAAAQDGIPPPDEAFRDSVAVDTVAVVQKPNWLPATQAGPVAVRRLPDGEIERLQKSDDYWYANYVKKEEPKVEQPNSSRNWLAEKWFLNLLWIIILCSFIGVVVWYLVSSNIFVFRGRSKKIEEGAAEENALPEDIFSIQYDREIARAVAEQNYRLAVRLWYLQTLKGLSDRKLIDYRADRPDGEYVLTLFNGPYYRDFFRLTRAFEYAWYGQFHPSAESYSVLETEFLNFKKRLAA